MNDGDDEDGDATLEAFVRLLSTAPRTYVDLMVETGASFDLAKDRMRVIRQRFPVVDAWVTSTTGSSRPRKTMAIKLPQPADGPIFRTTACPIHKGSGCTRCDGDGFKRWTRQRWDAAHPPAPPRRGNDLL